MRIRQPSRSHTKSARGRQRKVQLSLVWRRRQSLRQVQATHPPQSSCDGYNSRQFAPLPEPQHHRVSPYLRSIVLGGSNSNARALLAGSYSKTLAEVLDCAYNDGLPMSTLPSSPILENEQHVSLKTLQTVDMHSYLPSRRPETCRSDEISTAYSAVSAVLYMERSNGARFPALAGLGVCRQRRAAFQRINIWLKTQQAVSAHKNNDRYTFVG